MDLKKFWKHQKSNFFFIEDKIIPVQIRYYMFICKKCNVEGSENFYVRSNGRTPDICKQCEKERRNDHYQQNYRGEYREQKLAKRRVNPKSLSSSKVPISDVELQLFEEIRQAGYIPVLHETTREIFSKISDLPLLDKLVQSVVGQNYLDTIFQHRFESNSGGNLSVKDALSDDSVLHTIYRYLVGNGVKPTTLTMLSHLKYAVRLPSHFCPSSAASLFQAYAVGKDVYDPFAGWGGRALGAICSEIQSYVATDLQEKSIQGCEQISRDFSGISDVRTHFIHGDAIQFSESTNLQFDFILTSPPFLNTEDYGVVGKGSNWVQDLIVPLVRNFQKILRRDGKIAIHVQDRPKVPVKSVILTACLSSGFEVEREFLYGKTKGQSVLLFRRSS